MRGEKALEEMLALSEEICTSSPPLLLALLPTQLTFPNLTSSTPSYMFPACVREFSNVGLTVPDVGCMSHSRILQDIQAAAGIEPADCRYLPTGGILVLPLKVMCRDEVETL